MAKTGKMTADELKKLQKQLEKLQKSDCEAFMESCAKELAARLLAKVIKRTLPGQYPKSSGKKGGTLRRGWTTGTHEEAASGTGNGADATAYAQSLEIKHTGGNYTVEIVNPVEYASYVEFGHRKVNGKGWVQGKFMLTISEQELQSIAPKVLESKIKNFLGGAFAW